jgi:hypothetical protein
VSGGVTLIAGSAATIGPVPPAAFPSPEGESLRELKERRLFVTQWRGGAEIVSRKGYTDDGIAAVVCRLVQAVLRDEGRISSVSTRDLSSRLRRWRGGRARIAVRDRTRDRAPAPLALDAEERAARLGSAAILDASYELLSARPA